MSRTALRLAVGSVVPIAWAAVLLAATMTPSAAALGPQRARRVALPSPVPSWPISGQTTDDGPAGASRVLHIRMYLAGRNSASELRSARGASDPRSRSYGDYLKPSTFAARFGPTSQQVLAVERWARSAGLKIASTTSHYLAITGSAPAISTALDTSIHTYTSTDSGLVGYAPSKGMSVPATIASDISTVVGLDSYSFPESSAAAPAREAATGPRAAAATSSTAGCSHWWGQHRSAIPKAVGRSSAPDAICGYTPQQLRSAYGVTANSGKGATIAIVLDGHLATMRADADRFFADHHLAGFSKGQFRQSFGAGFLASCGSGFADVPEEPLDVETAHILAPKARIRYVAANCANNATTQQEDFLDAQTRIVDHHLGDVETNSFSTAESAWTPAMAAAWTEIFRQGAVEGTGFNFDSGDGGDDSGAGLNSGTAVQFPASDPWATAVGGTTLEIGRRGTIVRDLGWGDTADQLNPAHTGYLQPPPGEFYQGSTGGRSTLFGQPSYQRHVVAKGLATAGGTGRSAREVPDVSADASPMTGWLIGYGGKDFAQSLSGGTSGASPIVAALEADAKSRAGHAIGFANPLLYDLRHGTGIDDVRLGSTPALTLAQNCYNQRPGPAQPCLVTLGLDGSLHERVGYDDVTGVGGVNGRFIATLSWASAHRSS